MYDLIIIGGGPAGITAATVALSHRLEALIIAERWGGQTTYTMQLEDMQDQEVITGEALLDAFRRRLDYLDFARYFDTVTKLTPEDRHFTVRSDRGGCFEARALIIATGAKPQRLGVPGESELMGRGLSYSATAHASLFLGKDVAVVGHEQRALCAAGDLARNAHRVYLLAPGPLPDSRLSQKLRGMGNVDIVEGAGVKEVCGERYVEGIVVETPKGKKREIPVKGVFVKLPRTPNSGLVAEWGLGRSAEGYIEVDVNCATSWPGVFAAGDVTHVSEHVLVHIGEGAKAADSVYNYLLLC
jgi:alkyl hydroperoxide reductase subunit F